MNVADYEIGVLTTTVFGLPITQAIPVLLMGNLLGGLYLGLSAAMGPSLGFPQMFSARSSFGRRGNYIPGVLNWMTTVGWFTVNTILTTEAAQILCPAISFVLIATMLVILQVVIAVVGHDFIHFFEKVMSVVLGVLFLAIFRLTVPYFREVLGFAIRIENPPLPAATFGTLATVFAVSFSYIMFRCFRTASR